MNIFFVAFIGKNNEPLYFHSKVDPSEYLHMQMITYSCLDIVEERAKKYDMSSHPTFPHNNNMIHVSSKTLLL